MRSSRRVCLVALATVAAAACLPGWMRNAARLAAADWLSPSALAAGESANADALDRHALLARCVALQTELDRWRPPFDSFPPLVAAELRTVRVLSGGRADGSRIATPDGVRESDLVVSADAPHLDVGIGQQVAPDDLVLAGRWLIGRVDRVGRLATAIQTVRDDDFRQAVRLVSAEGRLIRGGDGLLVGTGDGCRLDHVPAEVPVAAGQWLVAAEQGAVLLCGRVTEATLPAGQSHWQVDIEPVARPGVGESVAVLRRTIRPERLASGAGR